MDYSTKPKKDQDKMRAELKTRYIIFDSESEADFYLQVIRPSEMCGLIKNVELQPKFILQEGFTDRFGRKHEAIEYRADFGYTTADGLEVVIDIKGMTTPVAEIKYKMVINIYFMHHVIWLKKGAKQKYYYIGTKTVFDVTKGADYGL